MKYNKYILSVYLLLMMMGVQSQTIYERGVDSYFRFQYSQAITQLKEAQSQFEQRNNPRQALKCKYYLTMSYFELGDMQNALTYLGEGIDEAIERYGEESLEATDFYAGYAKWYHQNENYDTAVLFYQEVVGLKEQFLESNHLDLGETYVNLGYAYDFAGKYDSALIWYDRGLRIMESKLGTVHPYTEWVYASIPYPASKSGQYAREIEATLTRFQISNALYGDNHEGTADELKAIAVAYQHAEDCENEVRYAEKYLQWTQANLGETQATTADAYYLLGNAFSRKNELNRAIENGRKSYELYRKLEGKKGEHTLMVLHNLGNIYFDAGAYAEAFKQYEDYYLLYESVVGSQSPLLIAVLDNMGQCQENLGQFAEARSQYQRAFQLKQTNAAYQYLLPDSYLVFSRLSEAQSDYTKALGQLELALQANTQHNKDDLAKKAFIYNNLGSLYRKTGEYTKSMEFLEQSLEWRKSLFGEQSEQVAQVYNNQAMVFDLLAKYDKGIELQLKNLNIRQELLGDRHPQIADIWVNLAALYGNSGDLKSEISYLQKALKLRQNLNPEGQFDYLSIFNNLTIALADLGKYSEALSYNQQAEAIATNYYGAASEPLAGVLFNRAYLYTAKGSLREAEDLYQQSLKTRIAVFGEKHLKVADTYNNLGVLYLDFNQNYQAIEYLEKALRTYQEVVGTSHPDYLTTRMNLALAQMGMSDYDAAEIQLGAVIDDTRNALGTAHPALAAMHQNLGLVQNLQDNLSEAQKSYRACLDIYAQMNQPDILEADIQVNLANISSRLGEPEAALSRLERAENTYKNQLSGKSERLTRLNFARAMTYAEMGQLEEAIRSIEKSIENNTEPDGTVTNAVLGVVNLSNAADYQYQLFQKSGDQSQLKKAIPYLKNANSVIRQAASRHLSPEDAIELSKYRIFLPLTGIKIYHALHQATGQASYLEEAFALSEASKSNALLASMSSLEIQDVKGIDAKILQQQLELRQAIQYTEQELFKLESDATNAQKITALKDQRFALNKTLGEVETTLRSNPVYNRLNESVPAVSVKEIQEDLASDEAVIAYATSNDSLTYTFVITADEFAVFTHQIDERLEVKIKALRNAIQYRADDVLKYVSEQLYSLLMDDAIGFLAGKEINTLTITPESVLNNFPFEVLYHEGKYLMEDFDIKYSYSQTLSKSIRERQAASVNNACLAFAPVFEDERNSRMTAGARDVFAASRALSKEEVRGFSINGLSLSPLPGTRTEVETISGIVEAKGMTFDYFLNEDAKEDVIKSGKMGNYKYLHFATHGFVNGANPQFSGIFMSQVTDKGEDCVLFASEIYNLDLQADLVSLSACETGLGTLSMGEGLIGLSRAFIYAGARNLLVSQWQVNDESTAKLMVDFYKGMLSDKSKAAALREAKLALLHSEKYSAPYYWAPFILVGE